jgi:DNA (cytosine-5)-methyltransferase 1
MKFIDLFAGLGGFHLAATKLGGECVFASEIKSDLRKLYTQNFGVETHGDIREVSISDVPAHDLLCAGFPCQPFSKAGDQMGWDDQRRGTVFWNIIEILRARKPGIVLLENVAHFVRHDDGNTYKKVEEALHDAGYHVDYRQYSPHHFGVPQIRERFYMIGSRKPLNNFKWPDPETTAENLSIRSILDVNPPDAKPLSESVLKCLEVWQEFLSIIPATSKLPSFPIWGMEFGATYPYDKDSLSRVPLDLLRNSKGAFGKRLRGLARKEIYELVPSHARGPKGTFPRWKQTFIRQNREFYEEHKLLLKDWLPKIKAFPSSWQKFEWNCQGGARSIWDYVIQFRASGVRLKRPNTAPSLVAMTATQVPIIGWEKRYMTPRECARLQSMEGLKELPKGEAAASAFGNAVNVTVVTKILEQLIRQL